VEYCASCHGRSGKGDGPTASALKIPPPANLTTIAARNRGQCPDIKVVRVRVSRHVCRHAAAMDLLHHGVDRSEIALWLGRESVQTT
jgi:integrase